MVLDWRLPGLNGLEAAARIRARDETRALPIVVMSAYAGKEEEARCAELGVNVFLHKPITASSFFDALAQAEGARCSAAPRADAPLDREFVGVRALLAEDNPANQMVASELLSRLGIELDIANNGREAVEMVRAEPDRYAAVLMDMQMPEMDGLSATRALRANPQLHAPADHCDDRQCDEGRPRRVPGRGHERLRHQADRSPGAPPDPAPLAAGGDRRRGRGRSPPAVLEPPTPARSRRSTASTSPARCSGWAWTSTRCGACSCALPTDRRQPSSALRAGVASGDAPEAARHAHTIAGAAGNLGVDALRDAAKALEHAARAGRTDLAALLADVEQCAAVALRSIDTLRDDAAALHSG